MLGALLLGGLGFYLVRVTGSPWWFALTVPAYWMLLVWRIEQARENRAAVAAWWRRRRRRH